MKHYRRRLIFGLVMLFIMAVAVITMAFNTEATNFTIPIAFLLAFQAGISLWLYLLVRETKRLKEENFRRKHQ